jgi:3',5'-cyclic AMP phosphodiesterase CpdA
MNSRIAKLIREVMDKQEWFFSLQVEVVLQGTIFDRISISLEGRDWRHVHIAHQKHVKGAKGKQVAWNKDGTRHDQMRFNEAPGSRKDV